jgi:hypothetical protein
MALAWQNSAVGKAASASSNGESSAISSMAIMGVAAMAASWRHQSGSK